MREPSPDWSAEDALDHLRMLASAENRAGMARFGINTGNALGVGNTTLRQVARKLKRDHRRALYLWATGVREARLLAAFTDEPESVTREQCRSWAGDFDSWDIVDGVAALFVETPFWRDLIDEFAADEREFVRRTAFAMLALAAVHRKKEPDATFLGYLPLIGAHARDTRNFVRKAVNWALRQIGKRSPRASRARSGHGAEPCCIAGQDCALDRQGCGKGTFGCKNARPDFQALVITQLKLPSSLRIAPPNPSLAVPCRFLSRLSRHHKPGPADKLRRRVARLLTPRWPPTPCRAACNPAVVAS